MAHWIIIDHGFSGQDYRCSNCRSSWNDLLNNPRIWDKCPHCGERINQEDNEYVVNLTNTPQNTTEEPIATPVEPGPLEDIVILSIEKYDQMKEDFEQCIKERDRALFEQEQELRNLQALVKALGITPEVAKRVYPDSVTVDMYENLINYTKRYRITFDVRR